MREEAFDFAQKISLFQVYGTHGLNDWGDYIRAKNWKQLADLLKKHLRVLSIRLGKPGAAGLAVCQVDASGSRGFLD